YFSFPSPHFPSFFAFFSSHSPPSLFYTLSLHDALPISSRQVLQRDGTRWFLAVVNPFAARIFRALANGRASRGRASTIPATPTLDRKSTRLNSSHQIISYAVFCLKKKKKTNTQQKLQQQ